MTPPGVTRVISLDGDWYNNRMSDPTCTIYIVRHGETEWNAQRRLQGQADTPLTEKGLEQARERANDLSHINFDAVFASDLERTMKTAGILKADQEMVVIATKLLRERAFGRFEGMTYEEFSKELADRLAERDALGYKDQVNFRTHEDVETDGELVDRGLRFIREVALAHPGEMVLMVSHGGMMQSLLHRFGVGVVNDVYQRILISNLGYFVLETDGAEMNVREMIGIEIES